MSDMETKIKTAWYKAIVAFTTFNDLTVINAEQPLDAPRPAKPYITLDLIDGPTPIGGIDEIRRRTDLENRFELSGMRQYTLNIQAFGLDSRAVLNEIQTLIDVPDFVAQLRASDADIAVVERGGVTKISEVLETAFEARYSMDITFNVPSNLTIDPGTIESIEYEGTISNEKDITIEGTVPET